jgi:hypothetical protein
MGPFLEMSPWRLFDFFSFYFPKKMLEFGTVFFYLQSHNDQKIGAATIRATQHLINASYNQRQRFLHLSPEPWMLRLQ